MFCFWLVLFCRRSLSALSSPGSHLWWVSPTLGEYRQPLELCLPDLSSPVAPLCPGSFSCFKLPPDVIRNSSLRQWQPVPPESLPQSSVWMRTFFLRILSSLQLPLPSVFLSNTDHFSYTQFLSSSLREQTPNQKPDLFGADLWRWDTVYKKHHRYETDESQGVALVGGRVWGFKQWLGWA